MVLTVGPGHSLAVRLLRVAFSLSMHAVDLVLTLMHSVGKIISKMCKDLSHSNLSDPEIILDKRVNK